MNTSNLMTSRLALIAKAVNNVQNKSKSFIDKKELASILSSDYTTISKSDKLPKIVELDFN